MNTRKKLLVVLLQVVLVVAPTMMFAEPVPYNKPDIVWTKSASSHTGRYVTKGSTVANSISLTLDGVYYYGDVENRGLAVAGGQLFADNVCGMAKVNYSQPVASMLNMRYSLGGGMLRGNNEKYADKMFESGSPLSYRKFQSWILNAAVGVEIFPIPDAGFYVYAGLMFNYSNVRMDYGKSAPGADWQYNWKNNSFLPMIPVEVGYQFKLKKSWLMNVHLGFAQGLGDTETLNLDGYPHDIGGNIRGTASAAGLSGSAGSGTKQWFDGWFNVGVTISYSWHNCEVCRLRKW